MGRKEPSISYARTSRIEPVCHLGFGSENLEWSSSFICCGLCCHIAKLSILPDHQLRKTSDMIFAMRITDTVEIGNGDQPGIPSPTFNLVQIAYHFLVHTHRFVHVDPGEAPLQITSPTNHENKRARKARENRASVLAEPVYLRMVVWIPYKAVLVIMTRCLAAAIGTQSTRNSWYRRIQNCK
jgi:hypothetical protein